MVTLGLTMWVKGMLGVGFLMVCIILILTVLIQRPSGGGLSGAFGSASGSGQTAFGAKTGDALTIFTIVMFVVFVLGGIGMKFITTPSQPPAQPALTSGSSGAGATAPSGAQGEGAVPAPAPAPEPGAASGEPEAPADPAGQPDPAGDGGDGGGEPGGL
jgi:preprotein translocase subunit SecG